MQLSWQPPATAGHPPFHKFVLQRQRVGPPTGPAARCTSGSLAEQQGSGGGAAAAGSCAAEPWETAADPDDELGSWWDAPPAAAGYRYRLAAWSAYGRSAYTYSGACTVRAVALERQLAPAEATAALAAMAVAGGNLSGRPAPAPVMGWSWSAASSAVVVALTILLKASQLRIGSRAAALWRALAAAVAARCGGGAEEQQQQQGGSGGAAAECGGLQRIGSSHASLASLGGDPAINGSAATAPVPGPSSLLHSLSSEHLLGSGESSLLYRSMPLQGSGLDPAAAADALDVAAEHLEAAVQRGQHCAHPGCHRRFDRLRDIRRKLEVGCAAVAERGPCWRHA